MAIGHVADFLIQLREVRSLSTSAIKGYRAAIAPYLRLRGLDISGSPELGALIKNLDLEKPATRSLVPKWDLTLVLRSLQQAPYEPLAEASLKDVTYKTVFLLALASAKRVSELHALSYVVSRRKGWKSMTLSFVDDFIAKTQVPGDPTTALQPFEVSALTTILGPDDSDQLLCPVRMVREYVSRTSTSRPRCRRLFVATNSPKPVSKNTISYWIRGVISRAYEGASPDVAAACQVKAHEVRAIATTLAFSKNRSLKDVMAAASWRSHSTFVSTCALSLPSNPMHTSRSSSSSPQATTSGTWLTPPSTCTPWDRLSQASNSSDGKRGGG